MFSLLIMRPDGKEAEQTFELDRTSVGRHERSDLRLVDGMVSRHHCLILREGERFLVKDRESRNGTWVNGRRIKNRRRIKHGDVIQVGPFRLHFRDSYPAETQIQGQTIDMDQLQTEPYIHRHETEKVVKPLGMIKSYLSETSVPTDQVPTQVRRELLNRNLLTLYRITEQLVVTRDLDETLEYIIDQLFEILSPSQATILIREGDEQPVPRIQRAAEWKGAVRPVSQSIINRILKERVSILTDNALENPRVDAGQSVVVDGIRSVMAAPIWEERTILGVIYVDSLDQVGGYHSEDLDLLTAIGHQTALAIQRWKLAERLREEAINRAIIHQSLARFHPPVVVDLILKGAADLSAKETVITVFFCDIVGFTDLCESIPPRKVQEILNMFFRTVTRIVFDEQGSLDKFIGDAAMAIFGAPMPQEDAPVRAVLSALQIRKELGPAIESVSPGLGLEVRYGINTGNTIVGNFGSDQRMDYTILGQAVNLAFRICKTAEPNQILVGPETFEGLKDRQLFSLGKVGTRQLKGWKQKMKLFEVKDYL